ncbi:MAG TPA: hypothetical protein VKA55_11420 [Gammaproteobacteria bacterium]|nr:hypothetical protein [Gammaproteobacteria bacterium]
MPQAQRPEAAVDPEGGITVRLTLGGGAVRAVAVVSRRPLQAVRVLAGKPAAEAPGMARRLFAVCGHAQGLAAAAALETAQGRAPSAATRAAREAVLQAETAREHITRILLGWSRWLGRGPEPEAVVRGRRLPGLMEAAAFPEAGRPTAAAQAAGGWETVADELETLLGEAVLGARPEAFLDLGTAADLDAFARAGAAPGPAFLRHLLDTGRARLGAAPADPLPALALAELEEALGGADGAGFAARPQWRGRPRETGPLARAWEAPPVAAAREAFGCGVLTRSVARLAELAGAPATLRRLAAEGPAGAAGAAAPRPGVGLATVEAARGLLVHRLLLDGDRLADYRILAPTEWNFHPDGCLARGLRGAPAVAEEDAREAAELLVEAVDPCVGYRVEVAHA